MNRSTMFKILIVGLMLGIILSIFSVKSVQGLLGDLDISGLVDHTDLAILDAAYGTSSSTNPLPPNWDARADINLDSFINLKDLTYAGRNYGDVFNFHWPRRVSNGRINNNPALTNPAVNESVVDANGFIHTIWFENTTSQEPLFYQKIDPSGNPVIEDLQISNDSANVRIATDSDGNAHIIYFRRFSNTGGYYTRLDSEGRAVISSYRFCTNCTYADIAVDEYTNAHIVFTYKGYELNYAVIGPNGVPLMPMAPLNAATQSGTRSVDNPAIAIDAQGNRHIFWHQYTDVDAGDYRYSRITSDGTFTANQTLITHVIMGSSYNSRRLDLAVDSQGAAHFMYHTGSTPGTITWRRIDPDGTLSAEKVVATNGYKENPLSIQFTIDSSDRIHYLAYYDNANGETGYGLLDRDGNILTAYQRVLFDGGKGSNITIDAQGNGAILTSSEKKDALGGYPLVVLTTLADEAANDRTRADLVVDPAHLRLAKSLLKITETADLTVTITNGGWATATGNTLTFSYLDAAGETQTIQAAIPDLTPSKSTTYQQLIPVPDMEDTELWEVTITVSSASQETTLNNNTMVASFGIFPPPRAFNLEVTPFDETYAPDQPDMASPFYGAVLTLTNPALAYSHTVDPTHEFNVFWEAPLDMTPANGPLYPTTYTLTLTAPGYSTDTLTVTARRYSAENPYAIVYDSPTPVKMYINSWGQVSGKVTSDNVALQDAQITLDNGQNATTDSDGNYTITRIPAGPHSLTIWHRGHEPKSDQAFTITQGQTTPFNISMVTTTRADVYGVVRNELGEPLADAVVSLLADPGFHTFTTTDADGKYSLSITPYALFSNFRIQVERDFYDDYSAVLSDLYPGWPDHEDLVMTYPASTGALRQSGSINSWGQQETWCKSTDEDLQWNEWILQKIGSKWCPSYEVTVDWGGYDYTLALEYEKTVSGYTIQSLDIRFENEPFTSYDVTSGGYSGGGESVTHTAQRIDWVELVTLDAAGNAVGDPIWSDSDVWYSTEGSSSTAHRQVDIHQQVPSLTNIGIRVFYTIGSYAPGENNNWRTWDPPADLTMGSASGRASGADRQAFTWWLASDTLTHRYAFADYRSFLTMETRQVLPSPESAQAQSSVENTGVIALTYPKQGPARVGVPWVVELDLTGAEEKPIYGIEFSILFNPAYLRLISVDGASDFAGTFGTFSRTLDLAAINQTGKLLDAAVVRLGAPDGLGSGKLVQVVFLPLKVTSSTKLDLTDVYLTDIDSNMFRTVQMVDNTLPIAESRIYLPSLMR